MKKNLDDFVYALCILGGFIFFVIVILQGCASLLPPPKDFALPSPTPSAVESVGHEVLPPAPTVFEIVDRSACAQYKWKDRSRAPIGYVKGVATVFARQVCEAAPVRPLGELDRDALAIFKKEPTRVNQFTVLLGLGMRESSGKYWEGRDTSASNTSSTTAETGIFQVSYNSMNAAPELRKLYDKHKADTSLCALSIFKEGVPTKSTENFGSDPGREFQRFTKACPAFATEYAALLIRVLRRHFGPLKIQPNEDKPRAEFRPECAEMFSEIERNVACPKK